MTDEKNKQKWEDAFDFKKEIASRIRNLRESKKYTIEKLSSKTKVPVRAIQQIEAASDEFYKEKVFAYGFIKILCKELKAPCDELLELCDKCFPQTNSYLDSIEDFKALATKKQGSKRLSPISKVFQWNNLKSISIGLIFIFVASFLYTLYQGGEDDDSSNTTAQVQEKKHEQKDVVKENKDKIAKTAQQEKQANVQDTSQKQVQNTQSCPDLELEENQGKRCVSLKVKNTTKFVVITDKKAGEEKIYEPGVYHFYYKDALEFTLDDASQVELLEGQKNWGVLSQRKEKKRIKFFNKELDNLESMPDFKL